MPVSPEEFRNALQRFASGVTVVTVSTGRELHGMTASSFASVSLEPPLVLVCLDQASRTRTLIDEIGSFAVSILSESQADASRAFSQRGVKPFDSLAHHLGKLGHPLLDESIAWIECRVHEVFEAGDHHIVIGEVEACEPRDGAPLLYFDQTYRSLS